MKFAAVRNCVRAALTAALVIAPGRDALAQVDATNEALAKCRDIVDASERLRCYDALAAQRLPAPTLAPPPAPAPLDRDDPRSALVPTGKAEEDTSLLSQRWELEPTDKYGPFKFTFYRPNYFLPVHFSDRINRRPQSPTRPSAGEIDYNRPEAAFQLSFKMKLLEQAFGTQSDIWLGYTQMSFWQIYNAELSREFRTTDFEPEVMWIWPTNYPILGLRGRLLGIGLVHQSNGQELPLSRSWNRVYVTAGFERGRFVFTAKAWQRLNEDGDKDDNPDIEDFVGRAEFLAFYRWQSDSSAALRLRTTFKRHPGWGSAQLDYRFPLGESLRGYVQFFSGYGETLVDYNFRKNSIGLGISVGSWY